MPFLTVLHKIRTQSGTPACSPTATAEMLSHTALRMWIPLLGSRLILSSGLDEGGEPVSWKTDTKVHSTHKAKSSLTVANTGVLPFTSTHIRVECRNKQTKLSEVPPAPSGLRGGRHKAGYTTTRETKQLIQNSIKQEKYILNFHWYFLEVF